jgi:hypothetical protein
MHTFYVTLAIIAGLAGYIALVLFVCKAMAFGMGTLPTQKQIVLDIFDGQPMSPERAEAIADYQKAKAKRDTRRQNAAAYRARIATVNELQAYLRRVAR